jgi:hypothetical protein
MTNFKKQIFSVVAAGSLLVSVATPVLADTTIQISGNGAGSDNYTKVEQTNTNTVSQNNTANVTNNVTSNADTGNNKAGFNTGGDVNIGTGKATTVANVTNTLNSNAAQIAGCNCEGDTNVKISGNGAKSDNTVTLKDTNVNSIGQNNVANVTNNVDNNANSGGNTANSNTGGDVMINTQGATAVSNVTTVANANSAMIGGGAGAGHNSASFVISGNGAGSDNWIDAKLNNTNSVSQGNTANVTNNVDSDAKTGYNDAGFNTGGDVMIGTGAAWSEANVDNMVNFNSANLDCGCVTDVLAKIDGNGATPEGHGYWDFWNKNDNTILLDLVNANNVGQGNNSYLNNKVNADAKTGGNDADLNTGDTYGSDPSIGTGPATNVTDVNNSGNVNTVGGTPFVIPMPGDSSVSISFNFQALMAFFGMHV